MTIYLQNPNTKEIVKFENENSIEVFFQDFKKLTKKEIDAYELEKAKEEKLSLLRQNRDKLISGGQTFTISVEGVDCSFALNTADLGALAARISILATESDTAKWSDINGNRIELNKTMFKSLYRQINTNDQSMRDLYSDAVKEVKKAKNLKELDNINANLI